MRKKINNTQLLKDTGLRIRHFNKGPSFFCRPMTVAYREGSNTIEFATAIVHPLDHFCRKIGTRLAVKNFLAGHTVRVPKTVNWQGKAEHPNIVFNFMFK